MRKINLSRYSFRKAYAIRERLCGKGKLPICFVMPASKARVKQSMRFTYASQVGARYLFNESSHKIEHREWVRAQLDRKMREEVCGIK